MFQNEDYMSQNDNYNFEPNSVALSSIQYQKNSPSLSEYTSILLVMKDTKFDFHTFDILITIIRK